MPGITTYTGRCHCGAVRFRLIAEAITRGCRCNCSICIRRGAVMSDSYFPPEAFESFEGLDALAVYHWGDREMNHYFCRTCGIHPFADPIGKPGHYRVNLGCLEGFDPLAVEIRLIDGKSF
jgi:hypothetical protein